MVNEDANAKLIRELKEEILKLRELLKAEGIDVEEGMSLTYTCFLMFRVSRHVTYRSDLDVMCLYKELNKRHKRF